MATSPTTRRIFRSVSNVCAFIAAVVSIFAPIAPLAPLLLAVTIAALIGTWTPLAHRVLVDARDLFVTRVLLAVLSGIFAVSVALSVYGVEEERTVFGQLTGIRSELSGVARSTTSIDTKMDRLELETSEDDPRKELAKLNVSWSLPSFYDRIRERDARAVELFLRAGMRPEDSFFWAFAVSAFDYQNQQNVYYFSPEIADLLLRADAFRPDEACVTRFPTVDPYFRYDFEYETPSDPDRVRFIRAVCARSSVLNLLEQKTAEVDGMARDPLGFVNRNPCRDRRPAEQAGCEETKAMLRGSLGEIAESGRLSGEAYRLLADMLD